MIPSPITASPAPTTAAILAQDTGTFPAVFPVCPLTRSRIGGVSFRQRTAHTQIGRSVRSMASSVNSVVLWRL